MYRCQVTGKLSRLGDPRTGEFYHLSETDMVKSDARAPEKLNRIVVQTRERIYTRWVKNEETLKWEEVEAGRGWEIVREINASEEGVQLWNSWNEEEREAFLKHLDS